MSEELTLTEARKEELAAAFSRVRAKLARTGADVCLLAATKHVSVAEINYAIDTLGLTCIGENRVQELLEKYDALHKDAVEIHLIGTLQSNKVKYIIGKVALIHSLDTLSLAREIEKQATKHDLVQDVLVEINLCGEETKSGISLAEVRDFLTELTAFPHIRVRGLMTMGKKGMTDAEYRMHFSAVRETWEMLKAEGYPMEVLSMGMSDSYIAAAATGATLVRVGTALFGARTYEMK